MRLVNEDIAYLLGMIIGKGTIKRGRRETTVSIDIPHKNIKIEGEDTQQSVKASLLDIFKRLRQLIGADFDSDTHSQNVTHISFTKNNEDFLMRSINTLLEGESSWRDFRIPEEMFSAPKEHKIELLRGIGDVTAHIRKTNAAFGIPYNQRVYIEIMDNWMLVVDICNLLKLLDIPVQTVRWAHPNFVDPRGKQFETGNRNYKEHQIKIYAEEFEKIGFNIGHKNRLLKRYANINREEWRKICEERIKEAKTPKTADKYEKLKNDISKVHHKFYWESKRASSKKPTHPDENNPKIHPKIRGKHFDSWKEVSKELGYNE